MPKITVKQAVSYTGKSDNTIRRLIKKYSKSTHDNSQYFQMKSGKHYIDKDFLKRYYGLPEEQVKSEEKQLNFSLIEHLKEQNIELNARVKELTHVVAHQSQQLANKDEQIRFLNSPNGASDTSRIIRPIIYFFVIVIILVFIYLIVRN